jgi:hypothetical protein
LNEELNTVDEALTASTKKINEKCDKSVELEDNIRAHNDVNHADENEPSSSKCDKCDFEVKDSKVQDDEQNLKCDICSMEFKEKVKLKSHMCRVPIANPTCGDY